MNKTLNNQFRIIVCVYLIINLLLSYPLWFHRQEVLNFPVSDWLNLSNAFHWPLYLLMIFSLIYILLDRKKKIFIGIFLFCSIVLMLADQNRWHPWFFYPFLLVPFLNEDKEQKLYTVLTCYIAATYFWSGYQKLNLEYINDISPWFLDMFGKQFRDLFSGIFAIGSLLFEIILGLGMLFSSKKRLFHYSAIAMHCFIIMVLTYHRWDPYTQIWNSFFIFMHVILEERRLIQLDIKKVVATKKSYATVFLAFIFICPVLNFFTPFDDYFAFSYYSGSVRTRKILKDGKDTEVYKKYVRALGVQPYPANRTYLKILKNHCNNKTGDYSLTVTKSHHWLAVRRPAETYNCSDI